MEKTKIETFIKKYNLGGQLESVIWQNKVDDLIVTAMTPDKKLFANVELKDGAKGFVDGVDVPIMDTERLKKMIDILSDDISLSLDIDENDKTRVRQIIGEDSDATFNFQCSDLTTIDAPPKLKNIPPYDVEIIMTPVLIEKFNKAYSSIQDDNTLFTLVMSKKKNKLEMILGYKQGLSDRIVLPITMTPGKDTVKNSISFNAKKLKEILAANDDVENPILSVSEAGLASISFENNGIKSQYYLVKIEVED